MVRTGNHDTDGGHGGGGWGVRRAGGRGRDVLAGMHPSEIPNIAPHSPLLLMPLSRAHRNPPGSRGQKRTRSSFYEQKMK